MCPYNKIWFSRNTDLFWQCFKNRCRVRYSIIHINNGKFHCVSASGKLYVLQCLSFYNVLASVTLLNHGDEGAVEPQAGSVKHNEENINELHSSAISKMMTESLSGVGSLRPGVSMGMKGNSFLPALLEQESMLELTGTHPGDLKNKPTVENLAFFWFSYRKKEKECNFL